jgi:hypothetical protein
MSDTINYENSITEDHIMCHEIVASAVHIKNDAGDWVTIGYDGTFECSNPDAVTELAEIFWNHLSTLPTLGTTPMKEE